MSWTLILILAHHSKVSLHATSSSDGYVTGASHIPLYRAVTLLVYLSLIIHSGFTGDLSEANRQTTTRTFRLNRINYHTKIPTSLHHCIFIQSHLVTHLSIPSDKRTKVHPSIPAYIGIWFFPTFLRQGPLNQIHYFLNSIIDQALRH
jgi:hypothetical protein